jgi:hypothetical protein
MVIKTHLWMPLGVVVVSSSNLCFLPSHKRLPVESVNYYLLSNLHLDSYCCIIFGRYILVVYSYSIGKQVMEHLKLISQSTEVV